MANWAIIKNGSNDPQIVKTIVTTEGPPPHVEEDGYHPIPEATLKPGWVYEEEPVPPPPPGKVELQALEARVDAQDIRLDALDVRVTELESSP